MKTLTYIAGAAFIAASLTACTGNGDNSNKTLHGTTDTMNAVAGSSAGGVNHATTADTSYNGNKNRGRDSTSNGNANPSGHVENDTTNQNKYHRP
ncbi:hypothetical protein GCM10027037_28190 [Mucilaginibacter koreensis]